MQLNAIELNQKLHKLEKENNLYEMTLNDEFCWPMIKRIIYTIWLSEGETDEIIKERAWNWIATPEAIQQNKNNSFNKIKKTDILLFDSCVPFTFGNEKDGKFTHNIKQKMQTDNVNFLYLNYFNKYENQSSINCYPFWSFFYNNDFELEENSIIDVIIDFTKKLEIPVTKEDIYKGVKLEKYTRLFTRYLLFKTKAKLVIFPQVMYNMGIYYGAKELDVKVVDIQYAGAFKYHFGYYQPNANFKIDYFLNWGEAWNLEGSPYEHYIHNKPAMNLKGGKNNKIKGSVLFLSQSFLGDRMYQFAYEFAKANPHLQVCVKPHLAESVDIKFEPLSNLVLLTKQETRTVSELAAEYEYAVSVSSTALVEAMSAGCKGFQIKWETWEYLADFLEKEYVIQVTTPDELRDKLVHGRVIDEEFFVDTLFDFRTILSTKKFKKQKKTSEDLVFEKWVESSLPKSKFSRVLGKLK